MRHLQIYRLIEAVAEAGSIRRAAEDLNIASSALNRRIQAFEAEFGAPIFERLPRGVRLNPAGELLVHHVRSQAADFERLRGQVADLEGFRRGHVAIACSQALLPYFLPAQIARYRAGHPGVSFTVHVRDRVAAERDLSTFASDLALVFEPVSMVDFAVLASVRQPVYAVMAADHPLAAGEGPVRLRDCLEGPHAVPTAPYGVRHLLELATATLSRRLAPSVQSDSFEFLRHYVKHERGVTFQIPIGLDEKAGGLAFREVDRRDVAPGLLLLGQTRGRSLPVAAARFADQLARAMAAPAIARPSPRDAASDRPDGEPTGRANPTPPAHDGETAFRNRKKAGPNEAIEFLPDHPDGSTS